MPDDTKKAIPPELWTHPCPESDKSKEEGDAKHITLKSLYDQHKLHLQTTIGLANCALTILQPAMQKMESAYKNLAEEYNVFQEAYQTATVFPLTRYELSFDKSLEKELSSLHKLHNKTNDASKAHSSAFTKGTKEKRLQDMQTAKKAYNEQFDCVMKLAEQLPQKKRHHLRAMVDGLKTQRAWHKKAETILMGKYNEIKSLPPEGGGQGGQDKEDEPPSAKF